MKEKLTFAVVGDYIPQRRLPSNYDGRQEVVDFLGRADIKYFNLETSIPNEKCFGNLQYGGCYVQAEKGVMADARAFGFNITTFANNHSLDFGFEGLKSTLAAVKEEGFPCAGAGMNLDEAAAPAYIDTPNGSCAVIGCASSMTPAALAMAGRQSRRVLGRPGINGIRVDERLVVTADQMKVIKEIADQSMINVQTNISRAEGFTPPVSEGAFPLQAMLFEEGETTKHVTRPNKKDLARIEEAIREARRKAAYVIVCAHIHNLSGPVKEGPADFFVEFAHRCIDAGAHAIIGHGPHIIRPIEIYKGAPIFYSLGNFVFQEELTPFAPEDMYEKYNLTSEAGMVALYEKRAEVGPNNLRTNKKVFEAIIPYFEMENDKLVKLEIMPISLGFEMPDYKCGLPRKGTHLGILERLAEMSKPYGVELEIREDGIGVINV